MIVMAPQFFFIMEFYKLLEIDHEMVIFSIISSFNCTFLTQFIYN